MNPILLTLTMSLPLAGCTVNTNPPLEGRLEPFESKQVHFASPHLRNETFVSRPQLSRDATGLLFVTLPVRSAVDKRLYVDYRVTFFDDNHDPLNQTTWFTKTLEPFTPDQITVNSTTARAADFQIDFRRSH